ncbi:MAG: tetratricopeptide repeat protein [Nitrospirota bacterium]
MHNSEAEELFSKGLEALQRDDTVGALSWFEKSLERDYSPSSLSCFAFCIARQRGQYKKAISLCQEAIQKDPDNSLHYLNLGKVYLLDRNRSDAITIFREGMSRERNAQIVQELERLGTRKPPVIPFLSRNNPLNKYLGIILRKLRIR